PVIPAPLAGDVLRRVPGHALQFLHQVPGLLHVDEAPGNDLRLAEEVAVMGGDGQDHHHHAVFCQALAVPHDHGAHVAHAGA
ncbi:hypothetical protein HEAFMP_HEAFMP_15395, partial [Dysosmobacter welbionis]